MSKRNKSRRENSSDIEFIKSGNEIAILSKELDKIKDKIDCEAIYGDEDGVGKNILLGWKWTILKKGILGYSYRLNKNRIFISPSKRNLPILEYLLSKGVTYIKY